MIQSNRLDISTSSSKAVPILTTHPAASITGFASATPTALTAGGSVGTATLVARADHSHPTTGLMLTTHVSNSITGFGTTAAALAASASAGTATTVSRSDHVHPTTGLVLHSLATAANDFLIASGAGTFVKKTLAETRTVLGLGSAAYTNHDTLTGNVHGSTFYTTPSKLVVRNIVGDICVRAIRHDNIEGGGTNAYFITQNAIGTTSLDEGVDNYSRIMSLASVQASVVTKPVVEGVLTGVISSHSHSSVPNVPTSDVGGNIWIG